MPLLRETDLQSKYAWPQLHDPRRFIAAESMPFDLWQGCDVLHVINRFAESKAIKDRTQGLKAERLIRRFMPAQIGRRSEAMAWLDRNWERYD